MGELPPTLNEIIGVARRNKFASAQLKRKWHERIGWLAKKMEPIKGKTYVECVWFVKNRRRDPDNICAATKYIWDTLVELGKLEDDSLFVIQSPVLHHFVIAPADSFCMYFRDQEAFVERQKENLTQPPSGIILREPLPSSRKRILPKRTSSAKATVKSIRG